MLYASTLCFYVQWFKLDLTFSMLSQLFWQAWSFLELIPTWFISCWKFGTHILTLLCAVVTIAEVACLRKHEALLAQQASEYLLSPSGTVLRNLLLMYLLWYFFSLFEIILWWYLMLYCLTTLISVTLTLLFIYFVLSLYLVSASNPQHQEPRCWLVYDFEMHVWHLMILSSFISYVFA